jgi:hypothetical protein
LRILRKRKHFNKSEEPYLILGESHFGSPLKSFIRRNVFSTKKVPRLNERSKGSKKLYNFGMIVALLLPFYLWWVMEYLYFGNASDVLTFLGSERGVAGVFSLLTLYTWFLILWMVLKNGVVTALVMIT